MVATRGRTHDGPILPRRPHEDCLEANRDRADHQQEYEMPPSQHRSEGVDVDVVRILPEDFMKIERAEAEWLFKQKVDAVELVAEAPPFRRSHSL